MYIVVVDSQQVSRMVLATHLKVWGYDVKETSDAKEAMDFISSNMFSVDMLITNSNMSDASGVDLARKIRNFGNNSPYIYIMMLSTKEEGLDFDTTLEDGEIDDFLIKPYAVGELKLRVRVANKVIMTERMQKVYNRHLERLVRAQTDEIRETQGEILTRLFNALECRDEETGNHTRRIGQMSALMGQLLGWKPNHVETLRAAAPLHDIGKIGIKDNVLLKAGALTPEEREQIKLHTNIGAKILEGSLNPVLQLGETIAKCHHENWDGSGYMQGLAGEEIPIEARIVSLVDAYDALSSDRVYRKGLPESEVVAYIRQERGVKFDPMLCDVFLGNLPLVRNSCIGLEDNFYTKSSKK